MKIITLTLSPAIDLHCSAEGFIAERENFANITSRDCGGKGVNLSRALFSGGTQSTAIVVLGKENGAQFFSELEKDGLDCIAITTDGYIRENITVHPKSGRETRLSFDGFIGDDGIIDKISKIISDIAESGDTVTLTGSLPSGISINKAKEFVSQMKARGLKVIIDSRSFSPHDTVECAPFLIKPNEEEIVAYADRRVTDVDTAARVASALHQKGIENVMISLGANGAVLACAEGVFSANSPCISPLSTIGAGDSSIAGFLAAYERGLPPDECLRTAVAYGSAACLTEGTKPPRKKDIDGLIGHINVKRS